MAAVTAGRPSKGRSKRVATACAFLSNISLDGNITKEAAERKKEKASPKESNEHDRGDTGLPLEATRRTRNKLLHSVSEPSTSGGESFEDSSKRSIHRQRSVTEAIHERKCHESSVMVRRSVSMSESSYDPSTTSVSFQRTKNRISCLAGSSFHHKRRANDKRIVLCSSQKAPLATYSVLKYHKENQEAGQEGMSVKKISIATPSQSAGIEGVQLGTIDKPVSYRSFLISTYPLAWNEAVSNKGSPSVPLPMDNGGLVSENVEGTLPSPSWYDPLLLDNPELKSGRHRKVLNLTSYLVSMVAYAKPSELKKDLNEQFREKFPNLNITLTKLRSLKRDIIKIALSQDCLLDPTTVGYAFVYFEKLILKEKITKANRKLLAGSCLLLAAKFNGDMKREKIKEVIEAIEDRLRISAKELIRFEFQVVIALEFDLHIPQWEILPHVKRMETE